METNKVKEVNVDNVIPFVKPKSGLSIRQEHLINETLILLNQYLTRINKYSVRELKESWVGGLYEENNSGVFDSFDIEEFPPIMNCYFIYNEGSNVCEFVYKREDDEEWDVLQFRKRVLRNDFRRKKISLWITKYLFSHFGTEEELDKFFFRSVFGEEYSIILYD